MLQTVYYPDAAFLLPAANLGAVPFLERETYVRVVRHHLQIHALVESDLAGEFRGSHLGHETVRQVSINKDSIRHGHDNPVPV